MRWHLIIMACGLALAMAGASGCIASSTVVCDDGTVCPGATVCVSVTGESLCVTRDQLAACVGRPALTPCGADSVCHGGEAGGEAACFPIACGNRRRDPLEVCDDGNNVPSDGCAADCRSDETCGNGVVDLVTGEQCDDGPVGRGRSHDGCASDCTGETAGWTVLKHLNEADELAIAYDERRDRIVVVVDIQGTQVWESDGQRWMQQAPLVSPGSRTGTAIAYDAARERVVLFGGSTLDDTWEWDGATWTIRTPSRSPPARANHAMVYDPIGRRVIVFGGLDTASGMPVPLGDTWAWDGVTWTPIAAGAAPSPRSDPAMAFDPTRGVVVLFGGWDGQLSTSAQGDTWELSGSTWTRRDDNAALARRDQALGYDPGSGRVLLQGGRARSDTWAWTGAGWTELPGSGGPTAYDHGMVTMARTGALLLVTRGLLYRWDGAWRQDQPAPNPYPFRRTGHAAAVDLVGRRMVVHGGQDLVGVSDQTLVWTGVWTRFVGATPGPLDGARMVYDERRGRFVLFGGLRQESTTVFSDETWEFDGVAWIQRVVATAPSPRTSPVMVYDAQRARVVLFGGWDGTELGDTWTWDGAAWARVTPAAAPRPRTEATGAYDPIRGVVVLFGGAAFPTLLRDTWEWDGSAWTERTASGPPGRRTAAAAWDAARRRVILYGGAPFGLDFDDQWQWDGTAWSQVPVPAPLASRSGHSMVSALDGAGVLVFGGAHQTIPSTDLGLLRWNGRARAETCGPVDVDGDGQLGCGAAADPDCWRVCRPLCPPGTTDGAACGVDAIGCGDRVCAPVRESCVTCPADCGGCPSTCGDATCDASAGETVTTCPGDCP